jgi:hypothetical protein
MARYVYAAAAKPKAAKKAETVEVVGAEAAPAPTPKFTPCRQCGYPADCERRSKCTKGFK